MTARGRHRHPGPVDPPDVAPYDPDAPNVTGVTPIPIPADREVVRAIIGGVPDPAVDTVVQQLIGPAEYTHDPVRSGGTRPQWGCSVVSHRVLGWCCNCPGIGASAELSAWRIAAAGCDAPDVAWARAVTAQCQR